MKIIFSYIRSEKIKDICQKILFQVEQLSSGLPSDTQQKEANVVQKLHSQSCAAQLGKQPGIVAEQAEGAICCLLPLKS